MDDHGYRRQHKLPPPDQYNSPPQQQYNSPPQQQYNSPPPQQSSTVVIMQQPTAVIQQIGGRDWHTGTCSCCSDIGGCCFFMFCTPCFMCSLSTRMNENCCAMALAPVAMRTKLRIENGINGSVCDDLCSIGCCPGLIYLQMDRELKHLGR